MKQFDKSNSLRFAFHDLVKHFNYVGWTCEEVKNVDWPYNTSHWCLKPIEAIPFDSRYDSERIKELLYAFGYFDFDIDYKNHCIYVII